MKRVRFPRGGARMALAVNVTLTFQGDAVVALEPSDPARPAEYIARAVVARNGRRWAATGWWNPASQKWESMAERR